MPDEDDQPASPTQRRKSAHKPANTSVEADRASGNVPDAAVNGVLGPASIRPKLKPLSKRKGQRTKSTSFADSFPDSPLKAAGNATAVAGQATDMLSPHFLEGTTLVVSVPNQGDVAPFLVPLERCPSLESLFNTLEASYTKLAIKCEMLPGQAASDIYGISATFPWNYKRQVIRRDEDSDGMFFVRAVERVWKKDREAFEEDWCEINLTVHITD